MVTSSTTASIKRIIPISVKIDGHSGLGLVLFILLALVMLLDLRWEWLYSLQLNDISKQITGFIVLSFIFMQWRLAIRRATVRGRRTEALQLHRWVGAVTPLVFYIHAAAMGYGYQSVLTAAFLGNAIVGLLSPEFFSFRYKNYYRHWLFWHLSLASVTIVLLIYHIYIVYSYS